MRESYYVDANVKKRGGKQVIREIFFICIAALSFKDANTALAR